MTRRLLNFLTALSFLLCVAASVLWARSHRHEDRVSRRTRGGRYTCVSAAGRVVLYVPPRPALKPQARRAAEAAVAAVRNDQVYWAMWFDLSSYTNPAYVVDGAGPLIDTPAD